MFLAEGGVHPQQSCAAGVGRGAGALAVLVREELCVGRSFRAQEICRGGVAVPGGGRGAKEFSGSEVELRASFCAPKCNLGARVRRLGKKMGIRLPI